MIEEITFYYPKGNKETYEVGREVPEGTVKKIEVEYNKYYTKAIIFFGSCTKVVAGIPFEYVSVNRGF